MGNRNSWGRLFPSADRKAINQGGFDVSTADEVSAQYQRQNQGNIEVVRTTRELYPRRVLHLQSVIVEDPDAVHC